MKLLTTDMNDCSSYLAEIKRLREQNRRLARKLELVAEYTWAVSHQSAAVVDKPSGVPRGKYIFAKGANRVAKAVLSYVLS